jgi:hypothetical protein
MSPAQTALLSIESILQRCPRQVCGRAAPCAAPCSQCAVRGSSRGRRRKSRPAPSRSIRSHRDLELSRPSRSPPSRSPPSRRRPGRSRRGSNPRGQSQPERQHLSRRRLPRGLLHPLLRPRNRVLPRHLVQQPPEGRRLLLPCLPPLQPPLHALRLRPAPLRHRHRPSLPRLPLHRVQQPGQRPVVGRPTRFSPRIPPSRRVAWRGPSFLTWSSITQVSGRTGSATGI